MKRIIIDADTGIDDSLAILYALRCPNFHVEGITTCFGNSNAAQSADNCLRLIKLSGCGYPVPVAVGANESLDGVFETAPAYIHGDNGIGNVILPESGEKTAEEPAWDFIIRMADELKGELVLVTTGRLTNLAKALLKDPALPKKIKQVVVMGGTIRYPGNVGPYAEANIYGDPKAADMVFRAGFRLTLVGLDVTMKTFITDRDLSQLAAYCRPDCRPIAEYIQKALAFYFEFHRVTLGMVSSCVVHDPLAMLIAEDPSLGTFQMYRAGVACGSGPDRGTIYVDQGFVPVLDREEIAVCMEVESEKAVRRLFSVFQDMEPGRYNWKTENGSVK